MSNCVKNMHFIHPMRMIVAGPSKSGKTCFVVNLINNRNLLFIGKPILRILWCCRNKNFVPISLQKIVNLKIHEGIPDINQVLPDTLIVIDDLMLQAFTKEVCELFTINSHHKSISVILILQNVYFNSKFAREISLNNQYLVYFKNPRDSTQFSILARQICPDNWRSLARVYKEITRRPFGHIIIDLSQQANDCFRFKTNIFNRHFFECFTSTEDASKNCQKLISFEKEQAYLADSHIGSTCA